MNAANARKLSGYAKRVHDAEQRANAYRRELYAEIVQEAKRGSSTREIADAVGLSHVQVSRVVKQYRGAER